MKREILFRGKRVDNGEWVQGYIFEGRQQTYILCKKSHSELDSQGLNVFKPIHISPDTVGQFTGLTDKNGVKIFEGDIVKTYRGSFYRVEDMIEFHSWIERQFARSPELLVSGNIHDNPDFL